VADCLELWKLNNLFKIFLLSFVLAFLGLVFILRDTLLSRYLLIPLIAGITVYALYGLIPLVRRTRFVPAEQGQRKRVPKTTLIGIIAIILLFTAAFFIVRYYTSPMPSYQIVSSQYFVLPDGTTFAMNPVTPKNECAWLESMNITTQQRARDQGLLDCDYAWPHNNLSNPTLFLEYENYTEYAYTINSTKVSGPGVTGTAVPCFTVPAQSFQCWVPPARISHLR
jgi:hypothetical protein